MVSKDKNEILPEGSQRDSGRDAQRMNIYAAKLVSEAIRTTLGPKGMDKMLVDSEGSVTVTNDGVTILREIEVDHPSAKMVVEVAKTQEEQVGDGTTSAVIIAGELLRKAEELLDNNIHPTVIVKGYRMATEKADSLLKDISEKVDIDDEEIVKKIGKTAMTGKGAEDNKEHLSEVLYKALKEVKGKNYVYKENIKVEKKTGGEVKDTSLIKGVVIDKGKVHSSMPINIEEASIALLNEAIEVKDLENDAKLSITDPNKIQEFMDLEESMIKKLVDRIVSTGANVVFCHKGIDDYAQHLLAKKGVYACRRVRKEDLERLSKATNASIVSDIKDISEKDIGYAGRVSSKNISGEDMTYVEECKNPRAVTILVRGATTHVAEEVSRAIDDALGDMSTVLKEGRAVAGAGSLETHLSLKLLEYSSKLEGREQLAVKAYAEALEVITKTLAENAGLDPIDIITELKSHHGNGKKWVGLNVFTGKTMDAWSEGVLEPLKVKSQAVSSAAEVAMMILRIDDVILSKQEGNTQQ